MSVATMQMQFVVAVVDFATRRIERFHQVIAHYVAAHREHGASRARTYELVRTLNGEFGETVTGAIHLAQLVRLSRQIQ